MKFVDVNLDSSVESQRVEKSADRKQRPKETVRYRVGRETCVSTNGRVVVKMVWESSVRIFPFVLWHISTQR